MSFNGRFIAQVIQYAVHRGVSKSALEMLAGQRIEELEEETIKVSTKIYNQILEHIIQETKDELFGLHLGNHLSLNAAGLILQIVQSSGTVREAIQYMVQFANLGCSSLPFSFVENEDFAILKMTPSEIWKAQSSETVFQTVDGMVIFTIREFQSLTRHKHSPVKIDLMRPAPKQRLECERILNCRIQFGQAENAIFLEQNVLDQKVVTRDYNLMKVLVDYAEKKLIAISNQQSFSNHVRQTIIQMVKPMFPTIEEVAENLNISTRSLQRKLKDEETTFKQIMDDLRKNFAEEYLKQPKLAINQIAQFLNYSDSSAFNRSFKRWFGMTPKVYQSLNMNPN